MSGTKTAQLFVKKKIPGTIAVHGVYILRKCFWRVYFKAIFFVDSINTEYQTTLYQFRRVCLRSISSCTSKSFLFYKNNVRSTGNSVHCLAYLFVACDIKICELSLPNSYYFLSLFFSLFQITKY